ncbi:hypothetical protein GQ53DRAFT_745479 [Thozetella sp. PMI_491]|nr:hypothetical protein GQ53DRAFT_745479 [Thozetella sp. PMI_491]
MASPRSPSVSDREDAPAEYLTPRSKIKQLLATVDSSDEESARGGGSSRRSGSAAKSIGPAERASASVSASDDEDDIVRPRGKFASRMLAQSKQQARSTSGHQEDTRERVRRILQQMDEEESANAKPDDMQMADAGDNDDADDIVAARPRKLIQRPHRSTTPEPNVTESGSPGLFVSPNRPESPGLFVTPSKAQSPAAPSNQANSDSEQDLPENPLKNKRFLAILERKRKEREAREAEEARKLEARLEKATAADFVSEDDDEDNITDDEGGRKLTQEGARPTRKASKKALEDMNRETQRMNRSLQLAHEAKTKKKITKSTLFERFNFRPEGSALPPVPEKLSSSSRPTTPVSALHTDGEAKDPETPPSSPPVVAKHAEAGLPQAQEDIAASESAVAPDNKELTPSLATALGGTTAVIREEKGKGIATAADLELETPRGLLKESKPKGKFSAKFKAMQANLVMLDNDDDELEILPAPKKNRYDAVFDRVPLNRAKESRPMQVLRALAQLNDPEKKPSTTRGKPSKPSMTAAEMDVFLAQRVREQAKEERDRRVELLKSKGIVVQSLEEREREMAQVEDIVARARREAEEIMQREREQAKQERKARRAAGEEDPLAWDDSDEEDDSYDEEPEALELSGSDEEMESDGEEESEEAGGDRLLDDAAESTDESSEEPEQDEATDAAEQDSDEEAVPSTRPTRKPRKKAVILSDEEDASPVVQSTPRSKNVFAKSPMAPSTNSPQIPTSVLRSATKTFIPGLPIAGAAAGGLGLTQIFAGTMDDSQDGPAPGSALPDEPRPTFEDFPGSNFSPAAQNIVDDMILDSQPEASNLESQDVESQGVKVNLDFSQSQFHGFDSLIRQDSQLSEMIEPSQDEGFMGRTPLVNRFVELPSTVETVPAGSQIQRDEMKDSPLVKRTGKLRRRGQVESAPALSSVVEDEDGPESMSVDDPEEDEFGFGTVNDSNTAFAVLQDAAKAERRRNKLAEFNKKKSKAREMVQEQAEESEDEYAGLGGADGEDSDDDDNASVKEMLDDETKNSAADERKLAALHADRERAADEKQVDKLFRDITSGMLRRKRRGSFGSLSDSDDGGEARRRMKRRQFAKMQKALFADERVSKLAQDPRTSAFLRSMQDLESDDDMDFILPPKATVPATQESQSDSDSRGKGSAQDGADVTIPDSQPSGGASRLPAQQRRTKTDRRPANLAEIRASLSNLLDDPAYNAPASSDSIVPTTLAGSDDEADAGTETPGSSNKENHNPRRTGRPAVVDRITLKRNNSSSLSSNNGAGGRFAFTAQASGSGGFRVPALLRRATTNSLMSTSSASSTGVTTGHGRSDASGADSAFGAEAKVKKNASKRSGINYFARENERRAALAEKDKRREAKKANRAEGRGKVVGGLFAAGKFE